MNSIYLLKRFNITAIETIFVCAAFLLLLIIELKCFAVKLSLRIGSDLAIVTLLFCLSIKEAIVTEIIKNKMLNIFK